MPYFPGFNFTDGNGNPITNSGGTAYMREPHATIASIAGGMANVGNLVGPAGVGGAVADLATTIGAPQETATIAGDVAAVATALAPVAVAILAPEVGLAAVAYEVINAAGALHQLYGSEAAHYNAFTVNGTYTLASLGGLDKAYFDGMFDLMGEQHDGVQSEITALLIGPGDPPHNLRALVDTILGNLLALEQSIGNWAPRVATFPASYPGPDSVDWGTPVVVTESTLIEEPMDGALLDWTATPPGAGGRGAGGNVSYYHLGFYTFISSDGYAEDLRYLSWNTHVLTPRSLLHPAKLLLYLEKPGCSVTVQPWSLA